MAFGREGRDISGNRLPGGLAGAFQGAVHDRTRPDAERVAVIAARLAQHVLDQARCVRLGACGGCFIGTGRTGAGAEQQKAGDPEAVQSRQHDLFLHSR